MSLQQTSHRDGCKSRPEPETPLANVLPVGKSVRIQPLVDVIVCAMPTQCKQHRHPDLGALTPVPRARVRIRFGRSFHSVALIAALALLACGTFGGSALASTSRQIDARASALAHEMIGHRVVLLGETHDNAIQHELRFAALRMIVEGGARPAIAFEQLDRDRQRDIDRARRERPRDADYLITRAGGDPGWDWQFYRPFIELALHYELPIVATNLSREDAMRVAVNGWSAVFNTATVHALRLDAPPADLWREQRAAVAAGHCNLLPSSDTEPLARAQIARDIVMAQAIEPYIDRTVVLLAGNGHVRRDIGVPHWLPASGRREAVSIGMLEQSASLDARDGQPFDVYIVTEAAKRADPCIDLAKRFRRAAPAR